MSELRRLPWGEKHLCGVHYTVKVSIGYLLYEIMIKDLTSIDGITVIKGAPSKKSEMPKYIVYGVITQDAFFEYLQVKEKAQARLLLTKAAKLLKSVHDRDLYLNPKKHEDKEILRTPVHEDSGLAA